MKIRDVKTYVLEAPLAEPFAYSQAWYERRGACLVEIVGEDGNSGWGEAFGPARLTAPIVELLQGIAGRRRRARHRGDLAEPLQPAARPRPEGAGDRGAERRRHRAVGPEGPPSRPAGAPAAGRPAAHPGRGLCHRLLSQARRRPTRLSGRGGAPARRRGLHRHQAEARLRPRQRREARRDGAAGGRRRAAHHGRCQPRL